MTGGHVYVGTRDVVATSLSPVSYSNYLPRRKQSPSLTGKGRPVLLRSPRMMHVPEWREKISGAGMACHPVGGGPCGDTARLQHQHPSVAQPGLVQQGQGDDRGLPRPRRGGQNRRISVCKGGFQRVENGVDRQHDPPLARCAPDAPRSRKRRERLTPPSCALRGPHSAASVPADAARGPL